MGCALRTLVVTLDSTDQKQINEAVALIQKWKQNIAKFEVDDAKRALASGEFFLSGDMLQVSMETERRGSVPEAQVSTTSARLVRDRPEFRSSRMSSSIFIYALKIAAKHE
ncbi:MAG: hypothetical protein V8T87_08325 [Victivallales bacterium]